MSEATLSKEETQAPDLAAGQVEKIYWRTFGCQMNFLDTELMQGKMGRAGYGLTDNPDEASLIIYNTCAVREHAEHKVISMMNDYKALRQKKPDLVMGLVGCMAKTHEDQLFKTIPGLDFILGPDHMDQIDQVVAQIRGDRRRFIETSRKDLLAFDRDTNLRPSPFQSFVRVMRGCDLFCTYCVVPYTRGRERSRSMDEIVDECHRLADDGVVEVTLLGQTVNAWGRRFKEPQKFADLLKAVAAVPGIERVRYITSHPKFVDEELAQSMAETPEVMPWLHLPVQSGSDNVLKRMKRLYTVDEYRRGIDQLRKHLPDINLATDWIVGFSGESDQEFAQSEALLREIGYSQSYIFKYSVRPGTFASKSEQLPDDVPTEVKKERNQILLKTQEELSQKANREWIGKTVEVLVEGPSKRNPEVYSGRDHHHHLLLFKADPEQVGTTVKVTIDRTTALAFYGQQVAVERPIAHA